MWKKKVHPVFFHRNLESEEDPGAANQMDLTDLQV